MWLVVSSLIFKKTYLIFFFKQKYKGHQCRICFGGMLEEYGMGWFRAVVHIFVMSMTPKLIQIRTEVIFKTLFYPILASPM